MIALLRDIGRRVLSLLPPATTVVVVTGPLRGARWTLGAGSHGHWLGTYEPQMQRMLCTLLKPGQVFFDVGAHAGFHALIASRLVGPAGRVVAFEPHPRNIANLRHHAAVNHALNLTAVQAAVAEQPGTGTLVEGPNSYVSHLAPGGHIAVALVSLDAYAEASGLLPDVVKIDAEGAESRVLAGAERILRLKRPAVILSVHDAAEVDELMDRLHRFGYQARTTPRPLGAEAASLIATP